MASAVSTSCLGVRGPGVPVSTPTPPSPLSSGAPPPHTAMAVAAETGVGCDAGL